MTPYRHARASPPGDRQAHELQDAAHALPGRRLARTGDGHRAVPAARPTARPLLRGSGRAARRHRPGGECRPDQGGRPLLTRARRCIRCLRATDDHREDPTSLSRRDLARARPASSQGPSQSRGSSEERGRVEVWFGGEHGGRRKVPGHRAARGRGGGGGAECLLAHLARCSTCRAGRRTGSPITRHSPPRDHNTSQPRCRSGSAAHFTDSDGATRPSSCCGFAATCRRTEIAWGVSACLRCTSRGSSAAPTWR